ncbi:unnamed protein product [Closterium sp. NIES-64]|nr:unnamed protein product [Closterium sp. NIES-64]
MGPPATVLQSTQNPPPYHPTPPLPPPPPREPREPEPAPAPPTPQIAMAAAGMGAPVTVFQSTQNPPPHHPSPPLPPPPPREPREPAPAPPTPQIAMAGMGAPVTVFAANFGSLKPRVLLIDGTCYASHAVIHRIAKANCDQKLSVFCWSNQRIARADRDQKLSFCCAQLEAAHPDHENFKTPPALPISYHPLPPSPCCSGPPHCQGGQGPEALLLLRAVRGSTTPTSLPSICRFRPFILRPTSLVSHIPPPSPLLLLTVVQRIARADRDQKLSFCCAQSETAHPYLAAFGLTPADVLLSPVYIQGYNASFSGTSGRLFSLSLGRLALLLCAQSEAAHPYLAAFGLNPSDVLLSLVYIQGFNASSSGTSGGSYPTASSVSSSRLLSPRVGFLSCCSATSGLQPASPLTPPHLPPPFEVSQKHNLFSFLSVLLLPYVSIPCPLSSAASGLQPASPLPPPCPPPSLLRVAWDLPLPYPLLASLLLIPQPLLNTPFLFAWRRRLRGFKQAPQRSSPPSLTLCPTNPSSLSNFSPSFPILPLPSPTFPSSALVRPGAASAAASGMGPASPLPSPGPPPPHPPTSPQHPLPPRLAPPPPLVRAGAEANPPSSGPHW